MISILLLALTMPVAPVICLDPGHPSEVGRGTQGKHLTEIHAAWIVANKLKHKLETAGYEVVLTKGAENQLVKNKRRADIANNAKASLLLRLHCDAAKGSGFTVYYPDREGKTQGKQGPSLQVRQSSRVIAERIEAAMSGELKGSLRSNGCLPDIKTYIGSKQGALTGSIFSEVPVVLVEMCVLTNTSDERFMSSEKGQAKMTEALLKGVLQAVPLPLPAE